MLAKANKTLSLQSLSTSLPQRGYLALCSTRGVMLTITASSLAKKAACTLLAGGVAFAFAPAVSASSIQKAFAADDGYTYCYAGLSWVEYWAGEGVYEGDNDASSDTVDTSGQNDCGAFDVVSRATTNHGLHRGSYQCNATIHAQAENGTVKDFAIGTWAADGKSFTTTSGDVIGYNRGACTDTDGTVYTLAEYEVYGTKYVPVKVKTSDYEAFKADRAAKGYTVTESGDTLAGGYGEGVLKSYSVTADVNANTHGLKTATKSGSTFSFSAADNSLTGTGIAEQSALKTVTETTEADYKAGKKGIYAVVANNSGTSLATNGASFAPGSFGELLRVDLCGDYGDLAGAMQSVTWTYYGDDSTGTEAVRSFGTKFAADNWMHKAMDIQLGLTDSIRCQFPTGYDGTGYWTLTVHALGYEDYTTPVFQITEDNFSQTTPASDSLKALLQDLVDSVSDCIEVNYEETSWNNLQTELNEAKELLANEAATYAAVSEQINHVKEAISALTYKSSVKKNTITLKSKTATVKFKALKKKKQTVQIKASAKGKATVCYSSASKNVTVNKKGKVTIKKGTKKGSYKVFAVVDEVAGYKAASAAFTIKVK